MNPVPPGAAPVIRLGENAVPLDWPAAGEAARTFKQKLTDGFFARFMSGPVILDIGYRGYHADPVPIFPHAIGVDLDYPGYDGTILPFADDSADTIYSSHTLEHIADYRTAIGDWHRVVKTGGYIVCVVPHQHLYEKRRRPPSRWNPDHKRFYTPSSLLREFEDSLPPNSYRVRHLRDADEEYSYAAGPEWHAGGGAEIELVVQKIEPPPWRLDGDDAPVPADPLEADLAEARREIARLGAEGDRLLDAFERAEAERRRLAEDSARWFDAAILAPAENVLQRRRRRRWAALARRLRPAREKLAALAGADRAGEAGQWARAARFYLDALRDDPRDPALWARFGAALRAAGRTAEAEFADRRAAELGRAR